MCAATKMCETRVVRIVDQRFDERPVARVVEERAGQTRGVAGGREGHELARQERLLGGIAQVKADVRVAPALVRVVAVELPSPPSREIADAQHGVGKVARHAPGGAIEQARPATAVPSARSTPRKTAPRRRYGVSARRAAAIEAPFVGRTDRRAPRAPQ